MVFAVMYHKAFLDLPRVFLLRHGIPGPEESSHVSFSSFVTAPIPAKAPTPPCVPIYDNPSDRMKGHDSYSITELPQLQEIMDNPEKSAVTHRLTRAQDAPRVPVRNTDVQALDALARAIGTSARSYRRLCLAGSRRTATDSGTSGLRITVEKATLGLAVDEVVRVRQRSLRHTTETLAVIGLALLLIGSDVEGDEKDQVGS